MIVLAFKIGIAEWGTLGLIALVLFVIWFMGFMASVSRWFHNASFDEDAIDDRYSLQFVTPMTLRVSKTFDRDGSMLVGVIFLDAEAYGPIEGYGSMMSGADVRDFSGVLVADEGCKEECMAIQAEFEMAVSRRVNCFRDNPFMPYDELAVAEKRYRDDNRTVRNRLEKLLTPSYKYSNRRVVVRGKRASSLVWTWNLRKGDTRGL